MNIYKRSHCHQKNDCFPAQTGMHVAIILVLIFMFLGGNSAVAQNADNTLNTQKTKEAIQQAITDAKNNQPGEEATCLAYISNLFRSAGFANPNMSTSAASAAEKLEKQGQLYTSFAGMPAGCLVYYDSPHPSGHVALHIGGGEVVHLQGSPATVQQARYDDLKSLGVNAVLGWGWLGGVMPEDFGINSFYYENPVNGNPGNAENTQLREPVSLLSFTDSVFTYDGVSFPDTVIENALVTQEGNYYSDGFYVGSYMLDANSTVENFTIQYSAHGIFDYTGYVDGKYNELSLVLAPSYVLRAVDPSGPVGTCTITCDGQIAYSATVNKGDRDLPVSVNLANVNTVVISLEGTSLCCFDAVIK